MIIFPTFSRMKIRSKLLVAYIGLLIPMFVIGGLGTIHLIRNTIQEDIESDLQQATKSIVNLVKTSAAASIKNHLKAVAEYNRQVAAFMYRQALAGEMTMSEARSRTRSQLLAQVIGETGYIYCIDSQGTAVVHPNEGVEGKDFSHFPFVYEQTQRKEGYIEYDWRNPGEPEPRAKALYMVYFEPFDWIISVSTYRDEFKSLLPMEDIRKSVRSFQFGPSGYVFVADEYGTVYGIVRGHGGLITCESAVEKGTTFRVFFPAAGLAQPEPASEAPEVASAGGQETILIVDDEPLVRKLGKDLLERFGYTVIEAGSGEEALR